jgi:hypothetical protein
MRIQWIVLAAVLFLAATSNVRAAVVHSPGLDNGTHQAAFDSRGAEPNLLLRPGEAGSGADGTIILARRGGHRGGHHGFRGHRGFKGQHFGKRHHFGHRHFRSRSSFGFSFFAPFYGSTYYRPHYYSSCVLYSPYYGYYRAPYYYCY